MRRGIIAFPGLSINADRSLVTGPVDENIVRLWVLYWDELVVPDQSALKWGLGNEVDFLEKFGFARRYRVPPKNGFDFDIVVDSGQTAFAKLESDLPGSWAIAAEEGAWNGPENDAVRAFRVELLRCLPVPDRSVPLTEILEFRQRRLPECQALLAYVDELYLSVLNAPDRPLAEHLALEKMLRGARDQLEVISENGITYRLFNIAADFNLFVAALAGFASFKLGQEVPQIVGNSLLAGGAISLRHIMGPKNPKKDDRTPFRYVASYHREIFT